MADRAERRREARDRVKSLESSPMQRYIYYAGDASTGVSTLFALFSPVEPSAENVAEFIRQAAAQGTRVPWPTMFTIDQMHAMPPPPNAAELEIPRTPLVVARADGTVH